MSGALIGALGDQWGWRSSFLVFVPFALASAWVAWRALPPTAWGRPDAVPGAGEEFEVVLELPAPPPSAGRARGEIGRAHV